MTVSEIEHHRRNSRARRNSVVQKIALSIPQSEIHLSLEEAAISSLRRSKSFNTPCSKKIVHSDDFLLYPYSENEKHALIKSHIDSFQYNVLLSNEEEETLNRSENSRFLQFLDACEYRKNSYEDLINDTAKIIENLSQLTLKYDHVTRETQEFQSQSDNLINEFNSYLELNTSLNNNLRFFELLESITRKLNDPNPNIVRKESFRRLLAQLDECLEFVQTHQDYKDIDVYQTRFKQCLTRALTLIRNYIVNHLNNIKAEITSKMLNTKQGSITEDALIYTRFGSDVDYLKNISIQLSNRAEKNSDYEGLLSDCFHCYFGIRSKFLKPLIQLHINSATGDRKSLVQFAQANISLFTKIYHNEHELFHKFFARDFNNSLSNWFQILSDPLYDTLRNSILRESSISALCELATLLEKYYEYDTDEPFEAQLNDNENSEKESLAFDEEIDLGTIFYPILQDVRSRLVFRAQVYVEENIVKYKATQRDFQLGNRKAPETEEVENSNPDDTIITISNSKSITGDWYPPLVKGVSLLSKIYQLVSSSVFDDLAHNIVNDCVVSLKQAYRLSQKSIGKLDSDLFYLKNLLMLRNSIQNFDIEYVSNETSLDFSGIGDIISRIRNGESVFTESGLVELVRESVPKVVNNMLDARTVLQTELRNIVHKFTEDAVKDIVLPISDVSAETAIDDTIKLKANIEDSLPRLKDEIQIFINESNITISLIDGIQELIIQNYEKYYNQLSLLLKSFEIDAIPDVESIISFVGEVSGKMYEQQVQLEAEQSMRESDLNSEHIDMESAYTQNSD